MTKQSTLDNSKPPEIVHEGKFFRTVREWKQFKAIAIETQTEKALYLDIGNNKHKWIPKSICQILQVDKGYIVRVPEWFNG